MQSSFYRNLKRGVEIKMLKETFAETIGLHKVQICCRPKNIKSKSVIEKCGLTYEGTLRDYFKMPDGSFESRMYFSILKDE